MPAGCQSAPDSPQAATYSTRRAPLLYDLYSNNPQTRGAIVGHVDYPKLETALLKDVDDCFYYGANCSSCLHASRLNLSRLARALGRGKKYPATQPKKFGATHV